MTEKINIDKIFICKICNKKYSSQSSLCNHNKKFHNILNVENKSLICTNCNKKFKNRSSKSMHKKKCKPKNDEINNLKNSISEVKKQFNLIFKVNNNNCNIINNTYVKFGDIDYKKIFNNNQVKNILNKQYKCLEESIKQIHFNKDLPEYNNIFITNMKDDIAYVFDGNNFISVRKNEMINDLIDLHMNEINLSLEKNKNKLKIEDFLNKLNDENTKFTDYENHRVYTSYKAYKINSIKLLIYNESDKKKLDLLNNMELKEKINTN